MVAQRMAFPCDLDLMGNNEWKSKNNKENELIKFLIY